MRLVGAHMERLLKNEYETMLNYDFRREMNFRIPVMFIYGDEENICPP